MTSDSLYHGREQSQVKHLILKRYLERFAFIIGSWSDSITYIDCFSGPWKSRSENYEDTSFAIAIGELRKARDQLAANRRQIELRCCFIEEDKAAFEKLSEFAATVNDIEVKTLNGELEESIDEIVAFVKQSKRKTFPFVFVDPKGWTGFGLDVIKPLLTLQPAEVLINFMTEHIRRFIDWQDESNQQGFVELFGTDSFHQTVSGLAGMDRDDAYVEQYMTVVQQAGSYPFASCAIVLNPETDRSHFHLVYLTRDPKGIEVFKGAERKSMEEMEAVRAEAQQRSRVHKTGQLEMFSAEEAHNPSYFESLRCRYCSLARKQLEDQLRKHASIPYDDAWITALRMPLVWESDLKEWIKDWKTDGTIRLDGLAAGRKVPKRDDGHTLVWLHTNPLQ